MFVNKHTQLKEILCTYVTTVEKGYTENVCTLLYKTENVFGIAKSVLNKFQKCKLKK